MTTMSKKSEFGCEQCGKELKFQERNLETLFKKDDFVRITMYCVHCSLEKHLRMPTVSEPHYMRMVGKRQ